MLPQKQTLFPVKKTYIYFSSAVRLWKNIRIAIFFRQNLLIHECERSGIQRFDFVILLDLLVSVIVARLFQAGD